MSVPRVGGSRLTQIEHSEEGSPRVPPDALAPRQRAEVLAQLGSELRRSPNGVSVRAEIDRVLESTDRVTLEQTLRAAASAGSLGEIAEAVGLDRLVAEGARRGFNVNDVLATSDTVRERGLTSAEARAIQRNFAGTLDPSTVRLRFTAGALTMGASVMVVGNTIHVDPTSQRWGFRPGTTLPMNPESRDYQEILLAHEPAHIWSYQHQGSRYAVNSVREQLGAIGNGGGRGGAYVYAPGRRSFYEYGEEQRAMIVQDYVAAQRALSRGETDLYLSGIRKRVDAREHLALLEPYIREMRSAGPGQPHPPAAPQPLPCFCPSHAFRQDGGLGQVGREGDAIIAGLGAASLEALKHGDPVQRIAGALGVAGAVAASLAPREQNATEGAHSGGSALLDQAGIPRGVKVETGRIAAATRLGYAAGGENPRAEVDLELRTTVADAALRSGGSAEIDFDGGLRRAEGHLELEAHSLQVTARAGLKREAATEAWARAAVSHGAISGETSARAVLDQAGLRAATARARVDAPHASADAELQLGRGGRLERARVGASVHALPSSFGGEVTLTPAGLDGFALSAGVPTPVGAVSAQLAGESLTAAPVITGGVTLSRPEVTVTVSGIHEANTDSSRVQLDVSIPLGR